MGVDVQSLEARRPMLGDFPNPADRSPVNRLNETRSPRPYPPMGRPTSRLQKKIALMSILRSFVRHKDREAEVAFRR